MPTNKPFFPNLRPVKKVITPQGEVLIRKVCKCGNEFEHAAERTRAAGHRPRKHPLAADHPWRVKVYSQLAALGNSRDERK